MPGGRPSEFSPEIANEICERIAKGESLRRILSSERDDWMPGQTTVFRWLAENEEFRKQYAHAREIQAETLADEILEIADAPNVTTNPETGEAEVRDAQRDRLRVDARKWLAGKLAPKKYGDKVAHVGGGPDDEPIAVTTIRRVIVDPKA